MSKKQLTRASRLQELEVVMLSSTISFGVALDEIQRDELHLETHDTFEQYTKDRWGFTRQHAWQLIKNAKTLDNVSTIVDTNTGKTLNNGQLREIGKIPEKEQAQVVAEVFSTCEEEGRNPTAKDFAKAVKEKTKVDAVLEIPVSATVTVTEEEYEDVPDEEEEPTPPPKPQKDWTYYRSKCLQRANELQRDIDDLTNQRKSGNGQRAKDAIEAVQRAIRILEDWR